PKLYRVTLTGPSGEVKDSERRGRQCSRDQDHLQVESTMSLTPTRRTFGPLLVIALLSSSVAADRAVTVVGSSKGKELETVTAAARETAERASWTVVAHKLPPERVAEVIRCSSESDARCIGQLLDDVGADRLIVLKLVDEKYHDQPVRVVYGTILRRGA